MLLKSLPCLALLVAGSLGSARAQTVYSAHQPQPLPLAVGFGVSNFDLDYGKDVNRERRMTGITATFDTGLPHASGLLRGFGLEVEGRDINYSRPASLNRMRQTTILGGTTYTWPYSRTVHPFAKYLLGMGSIDFPQIGPKYKHDTRAIQAPGIGLECKLFHALSVRGDYEYQFWPHLYGPHSLTPNGFTLATLYDFRHARRPQP